MKTNERISERRKVRHSERLQFKRDNELYEESKINPDTVDGQSIIDLNCKNIDKTNKTPFFKTIFNIFFKKNNAS